MIVGLYISVLYTTYSLALKSVLVPLYSILFSGHLLIIHGTICYIVSSYYLSFERVELMWLCPPNIPVISALCTHFCIIHYRVLFLYINSFKHAIFIFYISLLAQFKWCNVWRYRRSCDYQCPGNWDDWGDFLSRSWVDLGGNRLTCWWKEVITMEKWSVERKHLGKFLKSGVMSCWKRLQVINLCS